MKLILLLVLAALWAAPVCAESDIIARWTEIYARHGLALSREEIHARGELWLAQTFPAAKREAMTLEVKVVPDDYPALLDAFLDSGTPFFVRADVSHHLTGLKTDSWTDTALAYAPAVLRLVQHTGEERARRCSGIEMLANMRHTQAGEPLFRMANDTGLERSVRVWAIKYYPHLAPHLYAGIPDHLYAYAEEAARRQGGSRDPRYGELRAWADAAAYDTLNDSELIQIRMLAKSNLSGISYAAQKALEAQDPDGTARKYAELWRRQLLRSQEIESALAFHDLIRVRSDLVDKLLGEELANAIHHHHIRDTARVQPVLDYVLRWTPERHAPLLAAVEQALAEERARSGSGGQTP